MKLPRLPKQAKWHYPLFVGWTSLFTLRWLLLASIVGVLAGTASAGFLWVLAWATETRMANPLIIWLLPLAGLLIGLVDYYWAGTTVRGNNLVLQEYMRPRKVLPFRMAPLVFAGTILTHLFGGSAGREGTAVQMGSALADRLTPIFRLRPRDRRLILVAGISAGFASVFGTPLAGAVFALEVLRIGRVRYDAILPSFLAAAVGHGVCLLWNTPHVHYEIGIVPDMTLQNILWVIPAAMAFGLVARLFAQSVSSWAQVFRRISWSPLRPVVGGVLLAVVVWAMGTTDYIGLGIPFIQDSFTQTQPPYAFLLKILLTGLTLGAGFKGGEVTPLFFTGAALGNLLFLLGVPLPLGLLVAMGFVAVFSGATHTPLACTFMGIELFGAACGLYVGLACVGAYLFSGNKGIYSEQQIGASKHIGFSRQVGRIPN